jgi:hypothetical protein
MRQTLPRSRRARERDFRPPTKYRLMRCSSGWGVIGGGCRRWAWPRSFKADAQRAELRRRMADRGVGRHRRTSARAPGRPRDPTRSGRATREAHRDQDGGLGADCADSAASRSDLARLQTPLNGCRPGGARLLDAQRNIAWELWHAQTKAITPNGEPAFPALHTCDAQGDPVDAQLPARSRVVRCSLGECNLARSPRRQRHSRST